MLTKSGLAASVQYVSEGRGAQRVRARLPGPRVRRRDGLDRNPFPASLAVRLNSNAQASTARRRQHGRRRSTASAAWPTSATTARWLARLNGDHPRHSRRRARHRAADGDRQRADGRQRRPPGGDGAARGNRDHAAGRRAVRLHPRSVHRRGAHPGGHGGGRRGRPAPGDVCRHPRPVRRRHGRRGRADRAWPSCPTQLLLLLVVGGMALGCLGGFVVARGVR